MARNFLSTILFLTLLIPACQPAAEPAEEAPSTEADEAAIRESMQRIVEKWNAADLEGMLAEFTQDLVIMPPEAPAISGKEAVYTVGKVFLEQNSSVWDFTIEDVQISGDLAFVRGEQTMSTTEKESGETEEGEGKGVFIFRRESDGTWKGVIEIMNSNEADDDEDDDEHED